MNRLAFVSTGFLSVHLTLGLLKWQILKRGWTTNQNSISTHLIKYLRFGTVTETSSCYLVSVSDTEMFVFMHFSRLKTATYMQQTVAYIPINILIYSNHSCIYRPINIQIRILT